MPTILTFISLVSWLIHISCWKEVFRLSWSASVCYCGPFTAHSKAVFPLAKVSLIMPATVTVTTYLPWPPWAV